MTRVEHLQARSAGTGFRPPRSSSSTLIALQLLIAFCVATSWNCSAAQQGAAASGTVVLRNVNVVPMTGDTVLASHTVVVRDGRIIEVGPSSMIEVPAGARRIDGGGHYLLPGITDFHIHLRSPDELLSYLAHGVTTVLHTSGAMSGAPDLLRYRDEIARGERLGTTLYLTGRILDGSPPIFGGVSTVVTTAEEARRVVAEQHDEGYDFIKVYNNLMPDVLTAVVDAAHQGGMAVLGHIPRQPDRAQALQAALAAGMDVIAHGEEYFFTYFYAGVDSVLDQGGIPIRDDQRIHSAVAMTREAGAAVIPNLSFIAMTRRQLDDLQSVMAHPEVRYLHPDVRSMWESQNPSRRTDLERFDRRERAKYPFVQRLTTALNDSGVILLLGTDASAAGMYPGASAHLELRELVEAGLTPYEALATGTRNPGAFIAKHVEIREPFGIVAAGQRADLILVDGNPLEDIANASNIVGVMVRGQWISIADLKELRAELVSRYRQ
jgi:imidazolonepropionase-like amidohydrolase